MCMDDHPPNRWPLSGCAIHLVVFVFEKTGEGLHAGLQRGVLGLHLAAQARHHSHGGVQGVLMDQMTAVPDEAKHTVQTPSLKHCSRLPGTDQLQHLTNDTTNTSSANKIIHSLLIIYGVILWCVVNLTMACTQHPTTFESENVLYYSTTNISPSSSRYTCCVHYR